MPIADEFRALAIGIVLICGLAAFASGRLRHDLVAVLMLLAGVALGLVAPAAAFAGLGDPVVVTVAAVMVLSAAIARSGILRRALTPFRPILTTELGIAASFSLFCAAASAFINNVGALALLMPAAIAACRTAQVSPSRVLMPMAFASLLGGLSTLIGTPPNVIIAEIRADIAGTGFRMFDFSPVGAVIACIGVATMLALLALIPRRVEAGGEQLLFRIPDYLFEVRVLEKAREKPLTVGALRAPEKNGERLSVHAIDRQGLVFAAPADWRTLNPGDVVQLEGRAPTVQAMLERAGLEIVGEADDDALEAAIFECVVPERAALVYAPDAREQLSQAGAALLAVSRSGRRITGAPGAMTLYAGDVLLLQAPEGLKGEIIDKFGLLPLAERAIEIGASKVDYRPALALGGAIALATLQIVPLAVALLAAIAALALMGRVGQNAYRDIDWSVVLMLAALIPVAHAFSDLGAGDAIAAWFAGVGAGRESVYIIGLILGATMLVTPFVNNAAAVLIMAPIAVRVGQATGVEVDAILMAVAVGASCEFLTPIGHQSNTIVMGPGGYRFFDYARFGAPLSVVVLIAGTLLIDMIWAG